MQYLGCGFLILLLYLLQYLAFQYDVLIRYLSTYSSLELHLMAGSIIFIVSLYFLRPLYHNLTGKKKQKKELETLLQKFENNVRSDKHHPRRKYAKLDPKPLPKIIQKIALITSSSSTAQAEADFDAILSYGSYEIHHVPMHENAIDDVIFSIVDAIESINKMPDKPDIICIVRGGGTRDALEEIFNDKLLIQAIEYSSIPILTAIGHAKNFFLADDRSDNPTFTNKYSDILKKYFITPTDLAYFLNDYNEKSQKSAKEQLEKLNKNYIDFNYSSMFIYSIILFFLYKTFFFK